MATHSSTLAWRIPWTEEPSRLQSVGSLGVGHDCATSLPLSCTGEGNGNPLQYSCLENPRDGRAWWAAVYGVTLSQTRLKWLGCRGIILNIQKITIASRWCKIWLASVFSFKFLVTSVLLNLNLEKIFFLFHQDIVIFTHNP